MNVLLLSVVFATMTNNAGGKIVLTDMQGPCSEGQNVAIAYTSNGTTFKGCWTYADGLVFIKYDEGIMRTHEVEGFTLTETQK